MSPLDGRGMPDLPNDVLGSRRQLVDVGRRDTARERHGCIVRGASGVGIIHAMLVPDAWTWAGTVPIILAALALLIVPGLGVALILRIRVGLALGLAPVLSTGLFVIGGIVCGALRVRWSLGATILTVGVAWLASLVARVVLPPCRPELSSPLRQSNGRAAGKLGQTVAAAAGVVFAFSFFTWLYIRSAGSPDAFPQQPDTILHLALPQWMIAQGDVSYFHALAFTSGDESGGYPVAWHVMVATLSMATGAPVAVATSAFVLVVAGVVWPLGMAVLARTLFGIRPEVGALGAATAVIFNGYPFLQVVLGVLWPNFFGQALMPGALAVTVIAVRRTFAGVGVPQSVLSWSLVAMAMPGLLMAHFNSWVAYLVFTWMMLACASLRRARQSSDVQRRWLPLTLTLATLLAAGCVSLVLAPAGMLATGALGPETDLVAGLIDALFFAPRATTEMLLVSPLIVVGAVSAWRHNSVAAWTVPGCGFFMLLYFLSAAVDSSLTRHLTWPWYNISHRLAAIAVLPAALLLTAGLIAASTWLTKRSGMPSHRTLCAFALIAVLFVATGGYRHKKFETMTKQFHPTDAMSWVSAQELRSLRSLAAHIPQDSVVAANPWNGGTYLYVVSGRRLLWPTEKTNRSEDRKTLGLTLDSVGEDPRACAAARRQGVDYAITGGRPFAWATPENLSEYIGVDGVHADASWQLIAFEEPYSLYRLTGCSTL